MCSLPYDTVDGQVILRILVSIPSTSSAPPQLQLLSRYIGNFGTDSALFGAILRSYTYLQRRLMESRYGLRILWHEDHLSELLREEERKVVETVETRGPIVEEEGTLPVGIEIHVSEPIVDRKSVFVGRACRITDVDQLCIAALLTSRWATRQVVDSQLNILTSRR